MKFLKETLYSYTKDELETDLEETHYIPSSSYNDNLDLVSPSRIIVLKERYTGKMVSVLSVSHKGEETETFCPHCKKFEFNNLLGHNNDEFFCLQCQRTYNMEDLIK